MRGLREEDDGMSLINREDLIAEYDRVHVGEPGGARKLMEDAPTIEERKWIPVTERLPEYDGEMYLVTDYCEQINRRRIHISHCYINREGFWSDVPIGYKVIAWMPLPKPYTEDTNAQNNH